MNRKTLIAMFVAIGFLALAGGSHAMFDTILPSGAKAKGDIVGNKLMLKGGDGKWAPAPDGTYKMDDGKQVVIKGGVVVQIPGVGPFDDKPKGIKSVVPIDDKMKAVPGDQLKSGPAGTMGGSVPSRGGEMMGQDLKGPNKPDKGPNKPDKKIQSMPSGMGGPAAVGGGIMMDKDKPDQEKPKQPDRPKPDKPDKKGQMMADPATPGVGPSKALPMPQGIQDPSKATPMPQGTQGSRPPLGSPKDPSGPEGSTLPGGGIPPPMPR